MDAREHAIPLFIDADIVPVSFMYYKSIASIMHDIITTLHHKIS